MKPTIVPDVVGKYLYRKENLQNRVAEYATVTTSFFVMSQMFQRFAGTLSIHSGRNTWIKLLMGLLGYGISLHGSFLFNDAIFHKSSMYMQSSSYLSPFPSHRSREIKESLRKLYLSLGLFLLLENKLFHTILPSNIITTGVYAKISGSVLATGPVATEKQRDIIQRLGKRFGCHHCGDRQRLRKLLPLKKDWRDIRFIADHQPPTKIHNNYQQSFIKRLFGIKAITQRLYPQCNKCYLLQGSAVKAMIDRLIYHHSIRIYHFIPALTLYLCEHDDIIEFTDKFIDTTNNFRKSIIN